MVFARGRRAWYVYGGSTDLERERMPNYLLQWEAMRWAKSGVARNTTSGASPIEDEAELEADFAESTGRPVGRLSLQARIRWGDEARRVCRRPRLL